MPPHDVAQRDVEVAHGPRPSIGDGVGHVFDLGALERCRHAVARLAPALLPPYSTPPTLLRMPSKQVTDRKKSALAVASAGRTHAADVSASLSTLLSPYRKKGEDFPD